MNPIGLGRPIVKIDLTVHIFYFTTSEGHNWNYLLFKIQSAAYTCKYYLLGQRKLNYSLNFILPCPLYSVYFYNTSQLYLVLFCKFQLPCRFLTPCVYSLLQQKWKSYGIPLCMYHFAFNLEQKYKASDLNKLFLWVHCNVYQCSCNLIWRTTKICLLLYEYLHDAIPVVSSCHSEQSEKSHPKVAEMCMFTQTLAWLLLITLCQQIAFILALKVSYQFSLG